MAADLPKEFDVIVLGTGMPESIVAAAFSRIGQSVLHLDRNEYYSGDWASFNLKAIENWVKQHQSDDYGQTEDKIQRPDVDEKNLLEEGETILQLPLYNSSFSRVKSEFFAREEEEVVSEPVINDKPEDVLSETSMKQNAEDGATAGTVTDTETSVDENDKNSDDKQDTIKEDQTKHEQTEKTLEVVLKDCEVKDVNTENVQAGDGLSSAAGVDEKELPKDIEETGPVKDEQDKQVQESEVVKQEGTGADKANVEKPWTVNRMKAEWRRFNIDISPKVLFSTGDMVELLISSDIAKYCEFKTITRVLTVLSGQLEVVPCSRAGVFSSKTLSMLEKRMLMKFLQFCAEYENKKEEVKDFLDRPFVDFLASRKLSATVKHYIQHSIAMATPSMSTQQGLSQMRKFLRSLGRYGNTAFLWSLYGSGELPQSFCRMCAVFGGLYCLRMSASSVIVDSDNRCTGIVTTEGQKIKCKWLIMENSYAPVGFLSDNVCRNMSRAVIMTDSPLLPSGLHELSQMVLPCPDDEDRPVFIIELPSSSLSSPSGVYLFHLTRQGKDGVSPEEDLAYAVNLLFKYDAESEEAKPCILWSLYFCQRDTSQVQSSESLPSNVVLMSGPGMEIDIDRTVQEAKDVFQRILPEEEFLPKAPNPEDIVYIDDEETKVADGNTQSEFTDSDKHTDDNQSECKDDKTDNQSETQDENIGDQSDSKDGKTIIQSECTDVDKQSDDKQAEFKVEKTDNQSELKCTEKSESQSDSKANINDGKKDATIEDKSKLEDGTKEGTLNES